MKRPIIILLIITSMNLGIYNFVCALIGSQNRTEGLRRMRYRRAGKHLEHTHYFQQSYEYYYITKSEI